MIITILRKFLQGSIVENTLKYGCGAINIDSTRVGTEARTYKGMGNKVGNHENADGSSVYWMAKPPTRKAKREGASSDTVYEVNGRWPANFVLIHKEDCELKGTKKVNSNGHWTQKANIGKFYEGGWSHQEIDEGNKMSDGQGKETVADWDCAEGCPVVELDRQSGVSKSTGGRIGNKGGAYSYLGETGFKDNAIKGDPGFGDHGGASRFFKQFKKDNEMIDYLKKMITPPVEDACVVVSKPEDIDFSRYKKEVEDGALIPTFEPMTHGLILLGEPTKEQSKEIMDILKPGAHVLLLAEDIGYKGVINLEDQGFEVRDAIFVAEDPDSFFYTSKAGKGEREAGLKGFNKKKNTEVTGRKKGSAGLVMKHKDREGSPEKGNPYAGVSGQQPRANIHPTVKPIGIMEWCARDISPNSKVADPFLGSGTTGIAMSRLGHDFVGIEINPEYAKICEGRIRHWMPIGTEIESEAGVGKREPVEGEQVSIFDLFK